MSMSTEQTTDRERLDQTRDDLAAALTYAMAHGDGWEVASRILARWTHLQAWEAVRRAHTGAWGTIDSREHARAEAARLMKAIQQRQGMPPVSTETTE